MHETSLARAVLQQANRILREQRGGQLLEVHVQIGPLSGVEASLLVSAFDQLVGAENCSGQTAIPRLVVETTSLVIRCRDCNAESELPDFVFRCPACQGAAVSVVRGDQLHLMSIRIADDAAPEALLAGER